MDVYQAIRTRKSVRAYATQEVSDETLTRILEAARLAPSASNGQEWRFVIARDAATRAKLCQAARGQRFVEQAPVVLACCAETNERVLSCGHLAYTIDVAIAVDHITLCATAEGLGTCWIGAFDEQEVREILGIPPQIRVVALLPLGVPQDPAPVEKRRLALSEIVKYESWA